MTLTHAIEAYLLPFFEFFLIEWLLFKYFISKNLEGRSMPMLNFGVSTTILHLLMGGAS